jgi:Family of unknown function (DUF6010)
MYSPPPLAVMDYIGPTIGAVIFVMLTSLVKEPSRRPFNAILVEKLGGATPSPALSNSRLCNF